MTFREASAGLDSVCESKSSRIGWVTSKELAEPIAGRDVRDPREVRVLRDGQATATHTRTGPRDFSLEIRCLPAGLILALPIHNVPAGYCV